MTFEYTAIHAPTRGEKSKDARTPGERYALTLTTELNRMASDGWEYIRADILPSEERTGLTGRSTVYHNLLIFRRPVSQSETVTPVVAPVADTEPVHQRVEQNAPAEPHAPLKEPSPGAPVSTAEENTAGDTLSERNS